MNKFLYKITEKIKYYKLKIRTHVIGNYGMDFIETNDKIILNKDILLKDIENFIYIKEDAQIIFSFNPIYKYKEEAEFYEKLAEIFKILEQHKRKYNITINVENRELFKQSKALEHTKNINLTINNDLDEYTKEEYIETEQILDNLVKPIKESNLSPYEKYLAVYNIVKQYKEYKENENNHSKSRNLKYILKNEYIVCVGFANMLTTLLDKVGIPAITISSLIEDLNLTAILPKEIRTTILGGHQRNIVKIDDDKYNIHGIYISDATWDNFLTVDLYNNSTLTFNKLKESSKLESLESYDYLLDANNFEEFQEKINYYLSNEVRYYKKDIYTKRIRKAYKYTYNDILKLLYKLDITKYQEIYDKYNKKIESIDDLTTIKEIDEIYSEFFTEYGYYIIELSNNEIDINTTLKAATNVKRIINEYNDEKIKEWLNMTKQIYEDVEEVLYPYYYDQNSKIPNYLEVKFKRRVKTK